MIEKLQHYSRRWLNNPGHHGNGFIVTKVDSKKNDDGKVTWVSGDVTIADCSRSINLDFYIQGSYTSQEVLDETRDNDLAKIDLIIKELQDFRRVMRREAKKVVAVDSED